MDSKDDKIRLFFEKSLRDWRRRNGRDPLTVDEMWDAVIERAERMNKEKPS